MWTVRDFNHNGFSLLEVLVTGSIALTLLSSVAGVHVQMTKSKIQAEAKKAKIDLESVLLPVITKNPDVCGGAFLDSQGRTARFYGNEVTIPAEERMERRAVQVKPGGQAFLKEGETFLGARIERVQLDYLAGPIDLGVGQREWAANLSLQTNAGKSNDFRLKIVTAANQDIEKCGVISNQNNVSGGGSSPLTLAQICALYYQTYNSNTQQCESTENVTLNDQVRAALDTSNLQFDQSVWAAALTTPPHTAQYSSTPECASGQYLLNRGVYTQYNTNDKCAPPVLRKDPAKAFTTFDLGQGHTGCVTRNAASRSGYLSYFSMPGSTESRPPTYTNGMDYEPDTWLYYAWCPLGKFMRKHTNGGTAECCDPLPISETVTPFPFTNTRKRFEPEIEFFETTYSNTAAYPAYQCPPGSFFQYSVSIGRQTSMYGGDQYGSAGRMVCARIVGIKVN